MPLRRDRLRSLAIVLLTALAVSVLLGEEIRGFSDGLVAGFTDAR